MAYSCAFRGRHAAVMAVLLCACPVLAQRSPVDAADQLTPALLSPMRVIDPPALYLAQRQAQPFLEERKALMEAVIAAGDRQPDLARALTDLAEFFFAHAMAPEGLSVLGHVGGTEVPPAHELRAGAFELALGLIDPRDRPLTERARALLEPVHAGWADQPLFLALSHLRDADCAGAGPLLTDAVMRLARFPKPVQERVLPGFLECAIETEQWRLARDLAGAFDSYPALKDSPAYHFLLGRVAEMGDEPLAAFDSYVQAQDGSDLWAHRARRALVDLSLRHEAVSTEEAVTMLSLETELWRGDRYGGETLDDLASLQAISGDPVSAIESYGRLIQRQADSPLADVAQQKARALIDDLYQSGASAEVPLGRFMGWHERIAPYFRFTVGFALSSERFADRFLAAGATTVAAREYATIHDYLTAAQDLGIAEAEPGQLDRLSVKEAEALLAGGQIETLGALLAQPVTPADPDLARRYALVSARYLEETGQTGELLKDEGGEVPVQILRLRAQAQFERADWPAALAAYGALRDRLGDALPLPDAIRYLLAAHRNGDSAKTAELAQEFPSLTELPGWGDIARGLTIAAPELLPLREDTARARIENAQEMLDSLPDVDKLN
ncbi:hypothetical protein M4578_22415 [Salipiger sp. P9]|uniref:hypothetical protein n=1 Tax=Salipiger pentaromativorans TaxID=2943193 RepID=UPI002157B73D|nr:hypothetical protein [Salipiger pentaromativorans]MCR8550586.1 hypothetical protein [Salipiger pentaromativorans]